jgi:phage shock protein E
MILFSFNSNDEENIELSAEEFRQKLESRPGMVIDVRTPEEYGSGHLKIVNAQYNWNAGEFHDVVDELDRDKTYYLYCRTGNRSGHAARLMKEKGFENVFNVGGFEDLVRSGFDS